MTPPVEGRFVPLLAAAIAVMLIWILSFADPCLIAGLRGGPPDSANPIAVTSCKVNPGGILITRGDVIIRVAALAVFMGLFGIVGGLLDPMRRKRSFAGISALGATCAVAVYTSLQLAFLGASLGAFHVALWAVSVIVGVLASTTGVAIASATRSESAAN